MGAFKLVNKVSVIAAQYKFAVGQEYSGRYSHRAPVH